MTDMAPVPTPGEQVVAQLKARYPLPSEMRGESSARCAGPEDLIANLRRRYPTPSELRQRQIERAAREAAADE